MIVDPVKKLTDLAQDARRQGDRLAALGHFLAAAVLEPETPWVACEFGHELRELGRLDEAEAFLADLVARHDDLAGAWRGLALVARKRGDRAAALGHFQQAFARDPQNIWNLCDAAEELRELGRLDEAEAHYRQALDAKPDMGAAWRGLGLIARRRGDRALAAEHLRKAVALDPQNPWLACDLCDDLRELGQLDEAEGHYRNILAERPGMASAWRGLALLARKKGDRAAAAENFEKARALEPQIPGSPARRRKIFGNWGAWRKRKSSTKPPCRRGQTSFPVGEGAVCWRGGRAGSTRPSNFSGAPPRWRLRKSRSSVN